MAVARLGGGNNFAIYWLDLVTLGTIRLWWKFRLITLDPMLPEKLVLIWLLFSHVGFLTGCKLFIFKVMPTCTCTS